MKWKGTKLKTNGEPNKFLRRENEALFYACYEMSIFLGKIQNIRSPLIIYVASGLLWSWLPAVQGQSMGC